MHKVVYNAMSTGVKLSDRALLMLLELTNDSIKTIEWKNNPDKIARHDPLLIRIVENLGTCASGGYVDLRIAEIKGDKYCIVQVPQHNSSCGFTERVLDPQIIEWTEIT